MKTHKLGKSLTFLRMKMFHKTINLTELLLSSLNLHWYINWLDLEDKHILSWVSTFTHHSQTLSSKLSSYYFIKTQVNVVRFEAVRRNFW